MYLAPLPRVRITAQEIFSVKNISDVAVLIDRALLRKWTVQQILISRSNPSSTGESSTAKKTLWSSFINCFSFQFRNRKQFFGKNRRSFFPFSGIDVDVAHVVVEIVVVAVEAYDGCSRKGEAPARTKGSSTFSISELKTETVDE